MVEHDLATLLRDAEPPGGHRPDVAALWHAGRRRARRTRAAQSVAAAAAIVAVVGAAFVVAGGSDGPQVLDVVGPPLTSAAPPPTSIAAPTTDPAAVVPEPGPLTPPSAEQLAAAPRIEISRLGISSPILPATGINLSEGVGLVAGAPLPGEPGISVLVGHRTTWRADFLDLDHLRPGDRFFVVDGDRGIELEVTAVRIVPAAGEATGPTWGIPAAELAQDGDPTPRVRLVTFEPRYSAAQRLIVDAVEVASRP